MTTYQLSALADGATILFDSRRDVLEIDDPALSAAGARFGLAGGSVTLDVGGKHITLASESAFDLWGGAFHFADGSLLAKTVWFFNYGTPFGSAGNDLLIGTPAIEARTAIEPLATGPAVLSPDGQFISYHGVAGVADFGAWLLDRGTGTTSTVMGFGDNGGAQSTLVSANGDWFYARAIITPGYYDGPESGPGIFGYNASLDRWVLVSSTQAGVSLGASALLDTSLDGRYVLFASDAAGYDAHDTNGIGDLFVKDVLGGAVTNVSSWGTTLADGASYGGRIDAGGNLVAFTSDATNLGDGSDTNGVADVFLRDVYGGSLWRVSKGIGGAQANGASEALGVSTNGAYVLFRSSASNLVAGDGNGVADLFTWNRYTNAITRISVGATGTEANGETLADAAMSGSGQYVVFASRATNLVDETVSSGVSHIYVKNLSTGEIAWLSAPVDALAADGDSYGVSISDDGATISFVSASARLRADDTNGEADIYTVGNPLSMTYLWGGAGNDTYLIRNSHDRIIENAGGGADTVIASVSYVLPDNVERIYLTGDDDIDATGNALLNVLVGNAGDNRLDGGSGSDTVSYADAPGSVVIAVRLAGETHGAAIGWGTDLLYGIENAIGSSHDDTLAGSAGTNRLDGGDGIDLVSYMDAGGPINVSLALTGAQNTGGAGLDTLLRIERLFGSAFADSLSGSAGANILDGGAGNDTLAGGAGDDTYGIDAAGDVIVEDAGGGIDTVYSSVDYSLGANLENLTAGTPGRQLTGNSLANVLTGAGGNNTLSGGGGSDTANYAGASAGITVSLQVAGMQYTGAGFDILNSIENITGGAHEDSLTGSDGANRLDGGGGYDTLTGGLGDDIYIVDSEFDSIVEAAGEGSDTVRAWISWTLPEPGGGLFGESVELENLSLLGSESNDATGNALSNRLTGNAGANVLRGGAGNDTLDGGAGSDTASYAGINVPVTVSLLLAGSAQDTGGAGSDTLVSIENLVGGSGGDVLTGNGGANRLEGGGGTDTLTGGNGNDVYVLASDSDPDQIVELAGGGIDTVDLSASFSFLGANYSLANAGLGEVENLIGTAQSDFLEGNSRANRIEGGGGTNILQGGAGNDSYVFEDGSSNQVIEQAGGGTDTVYTGNGGMLETDVENMVLTGSAGAAAYGNVLDNVLAGNAGSNMLWGGAGNDTASYAGAANGVVVSLAIVDSQHTGAGDDTLQSIENLVGSAWNDHLAGDAGGNRLTGGLGNDTLAGGGGEDTLTGGAGNDTYSVDSAGDRIVEAAGGGIDSVRSSTSRMLGPWQENLLLEGSAVRGTGNELDNIVAGNAAANVLTGGAGNDSIQGDAGNDTLNGSNGADTLGGGDGADRFVFSSTAGADRIADFGSGIDRLQLMATSLGIGDGDAVLEGALTRAAPGGFGTAAELVVFSTNLGALDASSAAAAIGSANTAYAIGRKVLFAVDDGSSSALWLFTAADANAGVSAAELVLLATFDGCAATTPADYLFG